jgi:hypothetical protein
MKIYTTEVKRSPWAQPVIVSRTQNGRWIIDRTTHQTHLPANTFQSWEHAQWTGNAMANEELAMMLVDSTY